MIPGLISKSPISYGWSGYDVVEVFVSEAKLGDYEASLQALDLRIEKIQGEDGCLQYRLYRGADEVHAYEIIAAALDSEDDVYDIESYVGEKQFEGLDRTGARSIGALFVKEGVPYPSLRID